jgi:hypothetical protein
MRNALRVVGSAFMALSLLFLVLFFVGFGRASTGDLTCSLQVRDKVITGAYKVYGLKDSPYGLWLAKAVFKNETNAPIKNFKVRYKLGDYTDWSVWQEYPEIVPSQTVADLYYPILSDRCAKLLSQAVAELDMEYQYTDVAGKVISVSKSARTTMLGRNEFFFTDLSASERRSYAVSFQDCDTYSPLLASWVTFADRAPAFLASLAAKRAEVDIRHIQDEYARQHNNQAMPAADSEELRCLMNMRHCYEIMRTIRISYQYPAGRTDKTQSYNPLLMQSLQYPRDTIDKRSGTCIDLAICYASMIKSVGIEPILVSLDGHCFPMGVGPSGTFYPVEATLVGGATADTSSDFDHARLAADQEWAKLRQNGRFDLVRCDDLWSAGISPPELADLPADVIEHIRADAAQNPPQAVAVRPAPPPVPPAPQNVAMAAGTWDATVTGPTGAATPGTATVVTRGAGVEMSYVFDYQMTDFNGATHRAHEQNNFTGTVNGQTLTAVCRNATWTLDGRSVPTQGLPLNLQLTLGADGKSARGTVTNAFNQQAQVTMTAR